MDDLTNIDLTHQGGAAVITVFVLDWLKQSHWFPWMTQDTERLNKIISLAVAVFTTVGLSVVSHQGDLHTGGQITIAFPPLASLMNGVIHVATQVGMQEVGHKTLGTHKAVKALSEQLSTLQQHMDEANEPTFKIKSPEK